MCSISGAVLDKGQAKEMIEAVSNRGPDGSGGATIGILTMHANRLAIIDPGAEDTTPFAWGGWLLAYNGEIYNHSDIRNELDRRGHKFRTETDTETLIHAWAEWGEDCLSRLNGMFAFTISDGETLWLIRDRAGEKPLYYYRSGGRFYFASEAKVIAKVVCLPERRDAFFNAFEYCYEGTLWGKEMGARITAVLPSEIIAVSLKDLRMKKRIWWHPEAVVIDERTADQELEALLGDAIRLRMMSAVPVALYASGGIDSELIRSFIPGIPTISFDENAPEHKEMFQGVAKDIVRYLDTPVGSFSPYGLWWLSHEARGGGYKVVLSGEGADELFGGYARMIMFRETLRLSDEMPEYDPLWKRIFISSQSLYERITQRKKPGHNLTFGDFWNVIESKTELERACRFEYHFLLPMLLQMGDRMAMANGVENRCPFLDHRIVNFAFSLSDDWRIREGKGKVILRKILERRSPKNLALFKPKKGLYVPVYDWLGLPVDNPYNRTPWLAYQMKLWREIYFPR